MDRELLFQVLIGVVAVPVIQFVKSKLGLGGKWGVALTLGISLIVGLLVELLSGGLKLSSPEELLASVGVVASTAMAVYGVLKDTVQGKSFLKKIG